MWEWPYPTVRSIISRDGFHTFPENLVRRMISNLVDTLIVVRPRSDYILVRLREILTVSWHFIGQAVSVHFSTNRLA